MQRVVVVALACALGGCGGAQATAPELPRGSAKEAKKEMRGLLDECYRVLKDGSPTEVMGLLAPDLFFVGPGPADVGLDRAATMELAGTLIDGRKKHKLKSFGLEVFGGPDGHSAYAIDQLEYDGVAFAVTAVAAEVDGLWSLTAIEVSRAISSKRLDAAVAPGELPRWRPSGDPKAAHTDAPKDVVAALGLAGDSVDDRLTQYGDDPDAAFVGPSPDEVILGRKALGKKWKKRAPRWAVDATVAGASPDGGLVWVVANANRLDDGGGKRDRDRDRDDRDERDRDDPADARPAAPRRLFAIYRDDGGDAGWGLAVLHESAVVAR